MLAALFAVKMGGAGRHVDLSMTDAAFAHHLMPLLAVNFYGRSAAPARDFLNGGVPCYNLYRTKDDRYMAVGALELKFWQNCCDVLEQPDLKNLHWSLGQAIGGEEAMTVKAILDEIFSRATQEEWSQRFSESDCCVCPVLSPDEAIHQPHFQVRAMIAQDQHATEGTYLKTGPSVRFRE